MRDAISGIFSLTLLATFLVVISSIIAFTISYSKALRMKEFVITQYEKQECNASDDFWKYVYEEASRIGYSSNVASCEQGVTCMCKYGVCIQSTVRNIDVNGYKAKKGTVYTYAGINLPFLNQIFPVLKFKVGGSSNSCYFN